MRESQRTTLPDRTVYTDDTIECKFGGLDEFYSFNKDELIQLGKDYTQEFQTAKPWPHVDIHNFLHFDLANDLYKNIPTPKEYDFYRYDNLLENKFAFDRWKRMPEFLIRTFVDLASPAFLFFLENISGIKGLIPDPYLRGGGVSIFPRGGKLDVHLNNDIHPKLGLYRRLDVVLFMNKGWQQSWGGELEMWQGEKNGNGHELTQLKKKILPTFNVMIVMESSQRSYRGTPEPIKCPARSYAFSFEASYYTATPSPDFEGEPRKGPLFLKRPEEDGSLDELRKKRSEGRFTTNVTHELLSD